MIAPDTAPPPGLLGRIFEVAAPALDGAPAVGILRDSWLRDGLRMTAILFDPASGRPRAVARADRGRRHTALRREWSNLERLRRDGPPPDVVVPRPLAYRDYEDVSILVQSVVPGRHPAHPRTPSAAARLAARLSGALLRLHRHLGVRRERLTDALAERLLFEPLARYRTEFEPTALEEGTLARLEDRLRELAGAEIPLVLEHGDLCLANILLDGDRFGFIDWQQPLARALPAGDLFHLCADLCCALCPYGVTPAEAAFARDAEPAPAFRRVLAEYADALGLPRSLLAPLCDLYWLDYTFGARRHHPTSADPRAWSLLGGDGRARWLAMDPRSRWAEVGA